jgi:hypothetical protein
MEKYINEYLNQISASYKSRFIGSYETKTEVLEKMEQQFDEGLRFEEGKVYIKIVTGTSVHSFIVKEDGPKFSQGDILKAASWKAPAKNFARANVFAPSTYELVSWTGI